MYMTTRPENSDELEGDFHTVQKHSLRDQHSIKEKNDVEALIDDVDIQHLRHPGGVKNDSAIVTRPDPFSSRRL